MTVPKASDYLARRNRDLILRNGDNNSLKAILPTSVYVMRAVLMRYNKISPSYCVTVSIQLGVAEPLVPTPGADRIVVELPGIQDTARAKEI